MNRQIVEEELKKVYQNELWWDKLVDTVMQLLAAEREQIIKGLEAVRGDDIYAPTPFGVHLAIECIRRIDNELS